MNFKLKIIIDTREKRNELIVKALEKNKIEYIKRKLDFGDYSGEVIFQDGKTISLETFVFYERKRELTELSNTIWQGVDRFKNELKLASTYTQYKKLIIEDTEYYKNILEHNYRTKLPPNKFLERLYSLQNEYKFEIVPIDATLTGSYIYRNMYQFVNDNIDKIYLFAR